MKNLLAGIFVSIVFFGVSGTLVAQETIQINGVQATRVIIGPATTPIARTIKAGLSTSYYSARPGTREHAKAQKLYYFYGARHFEPLWLTEDAQGKVAFSPSALKIISVFKDAHLVGLTSNDYLTDDINLDLIGTGSDAMALLETAFSAATMRYAQDTHGGRIKPRAVSSSFSLKPNRIDEAATLLKLASASDPAQILYELEPMHREFVALKSALAGFYDGTTEEPIVVPEGKTLRLGMSDPRVPLMRERLGIDTPETTGNDYDDVVLAAIEKFQQELGLTVDGIVGPATIAALNGGSAVSKDDIVANMERWRWMPRSLGDFNVFVNIPEFRLAVMNGEEIAHSTRVVVGKPKHKTPIFSDEIEHIVVNPYWNVPASIANNEIAPKLLQNPGYISRNNMELLAGGRVIDAAAVDWSSTSVNKFRIRQRPGSGNALGSVKFLFPNKHAVYLHDTPSKSLFSRSYRAFSHGCVRVHNPWEFTKALLQIEPQITLAGLEAQRGRSERWNNLATHIPVHIAYFTLRVSEDGTIRSYGDVYGHNKKLKGLLSE